MNPYCIRCGIGHPAAGRCGRDEIEREQVKPRTIPEQLDAARDGAEFKQVLDTLFGALEKAMDEDDE